MRKMLNLSDEELTTLEGYPWSPGLQDLKLDAPKLASLVGLPDGLLTLDLGDTKITSLLGLPASLLELCPGSCSSLQGMPEGLTTLVVCHDFVPMLDLAPAFTAAYCGVLCSLRIYSTMWTTQKAYDLGLTKTSEREISISEDLRQATRVPLNKRPARVVCVVLSSSSVPRVGLKAAVRRLNRADLVREMAGMLDEVFIVEEVDYGY